MRNRTIVRLKFGSHLYGTATPASDLDFKSVFVPSARSILMQSAPKTISHSRPKGIGEKNYAGEVDEEQISIQKFLHLAAEGQTMALDMLFAPDYAIIGDPAWEWREIIANRRRLLTRKSAAFIGYARQQSAKYGLKGSRVAASRDALSVLNTAMEEHGSTAKLQVLSDDIIFMCTMREHMSVMEDVTPHGQTVFLWEVCDRKMPFTASIKNARDIMQRVVDEYGRRALMAETQQGIDWKALSHAVRVGEEAVELLQTGHITFPLPNATHIVDIKLGKLLYQDVAAEIEGLLERVEQAATESTLPDEPDHGWIADFVEYVHESAVLARAPRAYPVSEFNA
ncbi:DNA polymerase beta superfamily protein [Rhizobium azibense]|uniref:Putative nucleotidyltransferase n=1 Tax=Rhizobium azibense TaxID=1136135 RepID=A0A4R3RRB3_9HYPH|nr:nucleotidyltransferase domain-containing protein [Rhizobium azibense]TCU34136.1 putative nucleotidyltransferase [Rhizobium azibense]